MFFSAVGNDRRGLKINGAAVKIPCGNSIIAAAVPLGGSMVEVPVVSVVFAVLDLCGVVATATADKIYECRNDGTHGACGNGYCDRSHDKSNCG